jgi:hypothetical protein
MSKQLLEAHRHAPGSFCVVFKLAAATVAGAHEGSRSLASDANAANAPKGAVEQALALTWHHLPPERMHLHGSRQDVQAHG